MGDTCLEVWTGSVFIKGKHLAKVSMHCGAKLNRKLHKHVTFDNQVDLAEFKAALPSCVHADLFSCWNKPVVDKESSYQLTVVKEAESKRNKYSSRLSALVKILLKQQSVAISLLHQKTLQYLICLLPFESFSAGLNEKLPAAAQNGLLGLLCWNIDWQFALKFTCSLQLSASPSPVVDSTTADQYLLVRSTSRQEDEQLTEVSVSTTERKGDTSSQWKENSHREAILPVISSGHLPEIPMTSCTSSDKRQRRCDFSSDMQSDFNSRTDELGEIPSDDIVGFRTVGNNLVPSGTTVHTETHKHCDTNQHIATQSNLVITKDREAFGKIVSPKKTKNLKRPSPSITDWDQVTQHGISLEVSSPKKRKIKQGTESNRGSSEAHNLDQNYVDSFVCGDYIVQNKEKSRISMEIEGDGRNINQVQFETAKGNDDAASGLQASKVCNSNTKMCQTDRLMKVCDSSTKMCQTDPLMKVCDSNTKICQTDPWMKICESNTKMCQTDPLAPQHVMSEEKYSLVVQTLSMVRGNLPNSASGGQILLDSLGSMLDIVLDMIIEDHAVDTNTSKVVSGMQSVITTSAEDSPISSVESAACVSGDGTKTSNHEQNFDVIYVKEEENEEESILLDEKEEDQNAVTGADQYEKMEASSLNHDKVIENKEESNVILLDKKVDDQDVATGADQYEKMEALSLNHEKVIENKEESNAVLLDKIAEDQEDTMKAYEHEEIKAPSHSHDRVNENAESNSILLDKKIEGHEDVIQENLNEELKAAFPNHHDRGKITENGEESNSSLLDQKEEDQEDTMKTYQNEEIKTPSYSHDRVIENRESNSLLLDMKIEDQEDMHENQNEEWEAASSSHHDHGKVIENGGETNSTLLGQKIENQEDTAGACQNEQMQTSFYVHDKVFENEEEANSILVEKKEEDQDGTLGDYQHEHTQTSSCSNDEVIKNEELNPISLDKKEEDQEDTVGAVHDSEVIKNEEELNPISLDDKAENQEDAVGAVHVHEVIKNEEESSPISLNRKEKDQQDTKGAVHECEVIKNEEESSAISLDKKEEDREDTVETLHEHEVFKNGESNLISPDNKEDQDDKEGAVHECEVIENGESNPISFDETEEDQKDTTGTVNKHERTQTSSDSCDHVFILHSTPATATKLYRQRDTAETADSEHDHNFNVTDITNAETVMEADFNIQAKHEQSSELGSVDQSELGSVDRVVKLEQVHARETTFSPKLKPNSMHLKDKGQQIGVLSNTKQSHSKNAHGNSEKHSFKSFGNSSKESTYISSCFCMKLRQTIAKPPILYSPKCFCRKASHSHSDSTLNLISTHCQEEEEISYVDSLLEEYLSKGRSEDSKDVLCADKWAVKIPEQNNETETSNRADCQQRKCSLSSNSSCAATNEPSSYRVNSFDSTFNINHPGNSTCGSAGLELNTNVRNLMINVLDSDNSDISDVEITESDVLGHAGEDREVLELLQLWIGVQKQKRLKKKRDLSQKNTHILKY